MTLLKMSFFGAVIILAVLLIRTFTLHKLPKKTFLILWAVALMRLLIPFEISSDLSLYSLLPEEMILTTEPENKLPDSQNPQEAFENYVDNLKQQKESSYIMEDNPVIIDQNSSGAIYLPKEDLDTDAIPLPGVEISSTHTNTTNAGWLQTHWRNILPHFPLIWAAGALFCAAFFLISFR